MLNESIPDVVLLHKGIRYGATDLTEFGCTVLGSVAGIDPAATNDGKLQLGPDVLDIHFRVRNGADPSHTHVRFWKPSLRMKKQIREFNEHRSRAGDANAALKSRSYDELAAGFVADEQENATTAASSEGNQDGSIRSSGFKALAAIILLFAMLAVVVLAFVFLKSRNSLSVPYSALVGNFVPVNARVPGQVAEVFFDDGGQVKKGDLLMRLRNPDLEFNHQNYAAQRDAAKARYEALQVELKGYQNKLTIAAEKLDLDKKSAESRLAHAQKMAAMSTAALKRIEPGVRSGSVTQLEFDEVAAQLAAADAAADAEEAALDSITLSRSAISSEVLILGNRVNDEMGRIRSDLASAKAEYEQFKRLAEITALQTAQLDIRAPRSGRVHARYRQQGEYLKAADEAVAISYPGRVWASGHVTADQAPRVRPGQKVNVEIPSMHLSLTGTVSALGHRGVYSKGNYSAEFRGTTATDVPVKVQLDDVPVGVPSGIRLEMSIVTGFGVKWIDDLLGNTLPNPTMPASVPNADQRIDPSGEDTISETNVRDQVDQVDLTTVAASGDMTKKESVDDR